MTNSLDQYLLRHEVDAPEVVLDEAEQALDQRLWQEAIRLLQASVANDSVVKEKLGFALSMAGQYEEARTVLAQLQGRLGSGGMAALAASLVDGDFRQRFGSSPRPPEVDTLLKAALAVPKPVGWAYLIADVAGFIPHNEYIPTMKRLVERWPKWTWPRRKLAQRDHEASGDTRYGYLEPLVSERASSGYLADAISELNRCGRHQEAIRWLTLLAERELVAQPALPLANARIELQIALANIALQASEYPLQLCDAYAAGRKSIEGFDETDLVALLKVAAISSHAPAGALAIQALHRTWDGNPYRTDINCLLPSPTGSLEFSDETSAYWPYSDDLAGVSAHVAEVAPPAIRGLFRVALAEYCRTYGTLSDGVFAEDVQLGYEETPDDRCLPLLALSHVLSAEPDWEQAGRVYTKSQALFHDDVISTIASDPLSERPEVTDEQLTEYAAGMANALTELAPMPAARAIFAEQEGLRAKLTERKLYHSFLTVATAVLAADPDDVDARFDAALGAHWCDKAAEAKAGYLKILAEDPIHYSARFNMLLLCDATADLPLVEAVENSLASHPDPDPANLEALSGQLKKARSRCSSPKARKRQAINEALAQFKGLQQSLPSAGRLSLRDAVMLVTLFEACQHRPGTLNLEPFEINKVAFSPIGELRAGIFSLMRKGIIQVGKNALDSAFTIENGSVSSYHLGQIHWEVSPATLDLLQSVRELAARRRWLKGWCADAPTLARELAIAECIQYVRHCAAVRGFDDPDDPERLHAYATALIDEVPVTEAFNLIYLAARSAADWKAKYPVSAQQAGNYIVINGLRRLDSWREKRWELKPYERTKEVARSMLARVLHDQFLKTGEKGFSQRIADLEYPQPKQSFLEEPPSRTIH